MEKKCKKQEDRVSSIPKYICNAMQGLAYWIGYKKVLYQYYSLSESAIVTEFCSLLQIGLNCNQVVLCERQYKNFFNKVPNSLNGHRIDLTVAKISKSSLIKKKDLISSDNKNKEAFLKEVAQFVFEVKLLGSSKKLINKDLERLKKVKEENKGIITYLLLVSEDKLPNEYVNGTTGIALSDHRLIYDKSKYKLHVPKVKCVLDSKIKTGTLKKKIKKCFNSSGDIKKEINKQIDICMEEHFSKGSFVCLIEVL